MLILFIWVFVILFCALYISRLRRHSWCTIFNLFVWSVWDKVFQGVVEKGGFEHRLFRYTSKLEPVHHGLNIFSGISLLVVNVLSFNTKKFSSGEESWFLCGMSYLFYCYEKLCPIVVLFVYGVIFICYFISWVIFICIICNR